MYLFERVKTDPDSNRQHAALLADVFEKSALFTPQFIDWQYHQNPSGQIVGFNAMDGNTIAAHYVAQPFYAQLNGETHKGLLSLNTATHAGHRGKGLFTKLAEKTYETAISEGYGFVIGVANQNSVNGFTQKLDFQLVGPLSAKLGLGSVPACNREFTPQYEHLWNAETLQWRLSNPNAKYLKAKSSAGVYYAPTHIPFIKAHMIASALHVNFHHTKTFAPPVTLYIGTDASIRFKGSGFVDIPDKFRPSPLFLIYKDLTGKNPKLNKDELRFELIDFDAY